MKKILAIALALCAASIVLTGCQGGGGDTGGGTAGSTAGTAGGSTTTGS